jgi:hypothetical protein
VQEVIRISEEGHLPGIVAHMKALGPASWGLSMALVEKIKQARDRGVEVYADQYPYDASGTGIVGALIPRWAEVGGTAELLKRIQGPEHDRLAADIRRSFERRGGPDKLVISRYAANPPSKDSRSRRCRKHWASRRKKPRWNCSSRRAAAARASCRSTWRRATSNTS